MTVNVPAAATPSTETPIVWLASCWSAVSVGGLIVPCISPWALVAAADVVSGAPSSATVYGRLGANPVPLTVTLVDRVSR